MAAAHGDEGTGNAAGDDISDQCILVLEQDAVDARLGDADEGRDEGRHCNGLVFLFLCLDPDAQAGADDGQSAHGVDGQDVVIAVLGDVLQADSAQRQMHTGKDQQRTSGTDHGTGQQRRNGKHTGEQPCNALADVVCDGAGDAQSDGAHDDRGEHGYKDQLEHLRDDLVKELVHIFQDQHRQDDGDAAGCVLDKGDRQSEQAHGGSAFGKARRHGGVQQEACAHQGHGDIRLEPLCCRPCNEERQEVEHGIGGNGHHFDQRGGRVKAQIAGHDGDDALQDTGACHGGDHRQDDGGDGLKDAADAHLLFLFLGGIVHDEAHLVDDGIVDIADLVANDDLQLIGGELYAQHAVQLLDALFVHDAAVLQVETQTGDTVEHFLDVVFAANLFDDLFGEFICIHNDFSLRFSCMLRRTRSTWMVRYICSVPETAVRYCFSRYSTIFCTQAND